MKSEHNIGVSKYNLRFLLLAIETLEAEIEQLVYDKEWYSSDSLDLLTSAKQLLHEILEIKQHEEDYENGNCENLQIPIKLR